MTTLCLPSLEMENIQTNVSLRENTVDGSTDVAAVVGNEHLRRGNIKIDMSVLYPTKDFL